MIFYRGSRALVTHEVFVGGRRGDQEFRIRRLRQVEAIKRSGPPTAVDSIRIGSTGLAGAAAVAAVAAVASAPSFDSRTGLLVLVGLMVVASVVSGACWRARTYEYELRAVYDNRLVTLYRTTNATEFGQLRRALTRALELVTDPD
jgi:hypothetical protein